jgi:hypothetical protein
MSKYWREDAASSEIGTLGSEDLKKEFFKKGLSE